MAEGTIIACGRCGARCKVEGPGNPDAKMLRRSSEPKGLCVNCATHDWLRNTYPCNMLLASSGPKILLWPAIREQFADILRAGSSDCDPDEINWTLINENWELPFPHKIKPSPSNPCTQKELDEIAAGKREGFGRCGPPQPSLLDLADNMTITSFEQANEVRPGLGDHLKTLFGQLENTQKGARIMAKKNEMQKQVEKDEKAADEAKKTGGAEIGEQGDLMDVGPENAEEIIKAARLYRKLLAARLTALKEETAQKQEVLRLVRKADLHPVNGGKIKFTRDGVTVSVTPRDELVQIKEKSEE